MRPLPEGTIFSQSASNEEYGVNLGSAVRPGPVTKQKKENKNPTERVTNAYISRAERHLVDEFEPKFARSEILPT
jgi:hypothetical protein